MEWISFSAWNSDCLWASVGDFNHLYSSTNHFFKSIDCGRMVCWNRASYIRKPNVADFESLSEDVLSFKGFWNNKVTRILLIVVLANLGSTIGTFVGGADVIRLFFENL